MILDKIEWQAPILEARCGTWWHGEYLLRNVTQAGNCIVPAGEIAEFVVRVLYRLIRYPLSFLSGPSDAKYDSLFVRNARWRRKPVDRLVAKMWRQDLPAFVNSIEWDNHDKHAPGPQPAKELLEEYGFHALILSLAYFEIVGRIEVQERKRLDGRVAIKCAALDNLVRMRASLGRAVGIQFHCISSNASCCGNRRQRCSGASARIQCRCFQSGKL